MNAFFDGFLQPKTSLKKFVEQFEQALRKKVEKELVADAESLKYIKTFTKNPFEQQLQQLYNNEKYMEFSHEIKESDSCNILSLDDSHEVSKYVIREDIWVTDQFCKRLKFIVTFKKIETYENEMEKDSESDSNSDDSDFGESGKKKKRKPTVDFDVHCSCQRFESKGILCRHTIKVLILNEIRSISDKYILRRWRKDVKRSHTKVIVNFTFWENSEASLRYNQMCRKFSEVADLASGSDEQCKDLIVKQKEVEKAKMVEAKKVAPTVDVKDPSTKKRPGRPRSTRLRVKRSKKK
ncbi:hypothetical protein MKW98_005533, partial [Papaver atlanticum]